MSDPGAQAGLDQSSGNLQTIRAVALQLGDFLLARMTDVERCLVNNAIGVDHNVGLDECCEARFEIKRDEGRINLQKVQLSIVDRYGCGLSQVVINTSA